MNKGIVIKASIILGFFAIVLGLAFGCSNVKDENVTPQLENGEDVYLTVGDITVTNQDLWDLMKITDGVNYLEKYIQESLLADYIADVTDEEIEQARIEQIYNTKNEDVIAELQADEEANTQLILAFEQSMILQGLDPTSDEDLRNYFQLTVAVKNYTRDFIEARTDESSLYISDEDVQDYYEDQTKGTVCALPIRFSSWNEANAVFDQFLLVPNYEDNDVWGDYFGTEDITSLGTSEFDSTNTQVLTDEETFAKFIDLYNFMNPTKEQLDNTTAIADLCTTYDGFEFDYAELNDDVFGTSGQATLADTLWNDLTDGSDEESTKPRYTADVEVIEGYQVLLYKVSEEDVTAYADLDQATKDALYDELLEDSITSGNITTAIEDKKAEQELEIFDPILKLQYFYTNGEEYDNKGSETLVATYGDMDITAQELFDYMEDTLGVYYSMEMIKVDSLLYSDVYTSIYGDDYDFLNSDNETMVEHRDQLRQMKAAFSGDQYATYGFSSSDYTWEEFLVVAFGSTTESDVLLNVYVMANLQPFAVEDMIEYDRAVAVIQSKFDNYLNLDATHLLLYLDNDWDFEPDRFNDYVDELDAADLTEYNDLVVQFEDLVKSKINNDEYSFEDIVNEYKDSLIDDDDNDWKPFKEYGFYIMTEDLGTIDQDSLLNYDSDFAAGIERIYNSLKNDREDDDTITEFIDNQVIPSDFGIHFVIAEANDFFDRPSAAFDNTDTDYIDAFNNENDLPTQAQVEKFIELNWASTVNETVDFTIPTAVNDAIKEYYQETWDSYFTSTAYTIAITEYLLENNVTYTTDQADNITFLNNIIEVLYEVNFVDEYITPLED
ncbi:hypothetical protein [Candidatus Xianfuyuplasma coldseepsis]|uniref:Lipoprotein n=1 Tax=Candidatus Xianfuyuplasma coldseepsis TaxID=2782163 RepID=A0A7L7KR82_9MOLU|nr:hypothetical protein [Xianfuyuplasma coldseepsis]QMS84454.1 hypothetical protein G4Z02_01405 [Xianfuyuplasma coldseepsis]